MEAKRSLNNLKQNKQGFELAKKHINEDLLEVLKIGKITKKEAMEVGKYTTERGVRKQIQLISFFYPVISTSDAKGYRVVEPKNIDTFDKALKEMDELNHAINEIESRKTALNKRLKALIGAKKQIIKDWQREIDNVLQAN